MLVTLEGAIAEGAIDLYTHYKEWAYFYKPFNIKVSSGYYNQEIDSFPWASINKQGKVARAQYKNFDIPAPSYEHKISGNRKWIALHPFGSAASNGYWGKAGAPGKNLSFKEIEYIVNSLTVKHTVIIFASALEQAALPSISKDVYFMNGSLWDSLYWASQCHAFIGSDSCIKTMTAMCKIPSYVFCAGYNDPTRDEVFLDPYVRDGVMKVYKYWHNRPISTFDEAIEEILEL